MNKKISLLLFVIISFMLVSCKQQQQPLAVFFNMPFGEDVEDALAYYSENGEQMMTSYFEDEDIIIITVFQKTFYDVKFDYVELKFVHDRLASINLSKNEGGSSYYNGNPIEIINSTYYNLNKKLGKDYVESFQSTDPEWDIEYRGKGVAILISRSENTSSWTEPWAELKIEIRPLCDVSDIDVKVKPTSREYTKRVKEYFRERDRIASMPKENYSIHGKINEEFLGGDGYGETYLDLTLTDSIVDEAYYGEIYAQISCEYMEGMNGEVRVTKSGDTLNIVLSGYVFHDETLPDLLNDKTFEKNEKILQIIKDSVNYSVIPMGNMKKILFGDITIERND